MVIIIQSTKKKCIPKSKSRCCIMTDTTQFTKNVNQNQTCCHELCCKESHESPKIQRHWKIVASSRKLKWIAIDEYYSHLYVI